MTVPVQLQLQRVADRDDTREDWQQALRDVVTSGGELLALLGLTPAQAGWSAEAAADFPLRVPRSFLRRMRVGDPRDPLLLQVLARSEELAPAAGYGADPLMESGDNNPLPGLLHKYRGRALLIASGGCAVHCRYCFRRHFPYGEQLAGQAGWRQALDYVAADPSIEEVILSGGDPLVMADRPLAQLVEAVAAIPHVRRLRVHSRLPVVLPARITDALLDALCGAAAGQSPRLQTVMVIHSNHANELDAEVAAAVAALRARAVTVLNQSVLLAGVNDSVDALVALSERLFAIGVLPYYLHLLDKVRGAAHFDLVERDARALHAAVSARLPGYLVPRLVREMAGAEAKTVLGQ